MAAVHFQLDAVILPYAAHLTTPVSK